LRQLDPAVTASRPLAFFAYAVGYAEGVSSVTQQEVLGLLSGWGFPTNPHSRRHPSLEGVIDFCRNWEAKRESLDYEIDGVVIKVNRFDYQQTLGVVSRDPRWAVAFKFPARVATTRLLRIGLNVGRTGALNPYAELAPVHVGGVTIRMATLHNADDIRRKDIREGDLVMVKRAGDVIPQVLGPVRERRTGAEIEFSWPSQCPVCGAPVWTEPGVAMAYCTSRQCPAQRFESLVHFACQSAMDIRGLGAETVRKLLDLGLVSDPADFYSLTADELSKVPLFKDKSIDNLLTAIAESKAQPFHRTLFALGIRHVGERVAQLLAEHFGDVHALAGASPEQISAIAGVGPEIAGSVRSYFDLEENLRVIDKLEKAGVQWRAARMETRGAGPLAGKSFVITGTLPRLGRDEASALIERQGGRVVSAVSAKTDYLLVGESPGSKLRKAEQLGVPRISEEDLRKLIEGA
jgi:DNA ligase (NAD+)